jgi:hypothetical protein
MNPSSRKKIGGEFEIKPELLSGFDLADVMEIGLFSSGRSALTAILLDAKEPWRSKIHIPYYTCHTVVEACMLAGYEVSFYELTDKFAFPLEYLDLIKPHEVLLSINYFGFINDNYIIKNIRDVRPDIITVSDQVHSIWTVKDSIANYSFTSYRKHLSVTDGAIAYKSGKQLTPAKGVNNNNFSQYKLLGALLKNEGTADRSYLSYFEKGEEMLNKETEVTKASKESCFLLNNIHFHEIKKKRSENYKLVYDLLRNKDIEFLFEFDESIIPLCVPIVLENRDTVRRKMMESNIFLPIHWLIHKYNFESAVSKKLANHELSVLIDQRNSKEDIIREINCLLKIYYK